MLHRAPLVPKFLLVVGTGVTSFLVSDWRISAVVLGIMLLLFALSAVGFRRLWGALRPVAAVLLVVFAFQWWQLGAGPAASIVLNIAVCVTAAALLTATTPMQRILDGIVTAAGPLRRFGADPERFALTIAIMIRSIPFIVGTFADVRDSARARGLERNARALVLPVFIATVAYARQTGDALAARGLGESDVADQDRGAHPTGTTDQREAKGARLPRSARLGKKPDNQDSA